MEIERPTRARFMIRLRGVRRLIPAAAVLIGSIALPLLSAAPAAAGALPAASAASAKYAVGTITDTFVDGSRTTPAWNGQAALPSRTLVTTILYPAVGAPGTTRSPGAAPDKAAGPFPLIVFAHGLGASPQDYLNVLTAWAAAGFVVAAPLFPLSNSAVVGGPDAGDVTNQPKDMSYVIDAMLFDSLLAPPDRCLVWSTRRRSVPPVTPTGP